MTLAFHIKEDKFDFYGRNFNLECAIGLAKSYPDNHFVLLFDKVFYNKPFPANCTVVTLYPEIKNNLSRYYWYNFKLPAAIHKYGVDIFIPHQGCFSIKCKCRQLLIIQNEQELYRTGEKATKQLSAYVSNAVATILTFPAVLAYENKYPDKKFIHIPFGFDPAFKPFTFAEKEKVKEKFTSGVDYFLAKLEIDDPALFKTILKSFSHFKKWQKSSLKLVVIAPRTKKSKLMEDFNLYKYRDEIIILFQDETDRSTLPMLLASAYACLLFDYIAAIACVKTLTPVILVGKEYKDMYGAVMIYAEADEKELSKQLILLYKDEQSRSEVISHCQFLSLQYTWENAARLMWQGISTNL